MVTCAGDEVRMRSMTGDERCSGKGGKDTGG